MYESKKPGDRLPIPKSALILLAALALGIVPLVILVRGLLPDSSAQPNPAVIAPAPLEHDSSREITVNSDQVTLYVPEAAVDLSGSFVILPRQPNLFSYAGEAEWTRPVVVDIQYRNADGVHFPGITFAEPVIICFALTPEQWIDFSKRPDGYQVQYFDDQQSPFRWVPYPLAMDPEENQLCTHTDHLSIYALAVREQEVIPITGATTFPTLIPTPTETAIINTPEKRPEREQDPTPVNTRPPTDPPPTRRPPTDPPPPTEPPTTEPSYPNPE